ncbi:hypothetical protein THIOM_001074 [Candidatus Thiomargarita nelsonii]|uniref:Uncharacterized protein n=1 Tax=Candidatus Thiomargarita nelsonii TaxID=1003181 RepID=A0A176S5G1_9GAMM|nr:hypothetical protein THIOM_001074 [Candidatus Thiomargarita nelsonii]
MWACISHPSHRILRFPGYGHRSICGHHRQPGSLAGFLLSVYSLLCSSAILVVYTHIPSTADSFHRS